LLAIADSSSTKPFAWLRKALDIEPNNPNYLDSLGWRTSAAAITTSREVPRPRRAQMPRNATVQEHMGDVLASAGPLADAIAAWTRALQAEEGDVNKAAVEKKIQTQGVRCAEQLQGEPS